MVYEDSASVAVWSLIARDGMTWRARSDVDETMPAGKEISTK